MSRVRVPAPLSRGISSTVPRALRFRATLLALALLVSAPAVAAARPVPAVAGGTGTTASDYPFMAALFEPGGGPVDGYFCGGTVIAPRRVLTALRCTIDDAGADRKPHRVHVLVGNSRLDLGDGMKIGVTRIDRDPQFDPGTRAHDVAVLELANDAAVTPVRLAGADDVALEDPGTEAIVLGFGLTGPPSDGVASHVLQAATVRVLAPAACAAFPFVADLQLCAGDPAGGVDACAGDTGGPLLAGAGDGIRQIGVYSYGGEPCAQAGVPSVYARISGERCGIAPEAPGTPPSRPAIVAVSVGPGTVRVEFTPPPCANPAVVGYTLRVLSGAGVTVGEASGGADVRVLSLAGLPRGVPLTLDLVATSPAGESPPSVRTVTAASSIGTGSIRPDGVAHGVVAAVMRLEPGPEAGTYEVTLRDPAGSPVVRRTGSFAASTPLTERFLLRAASPGTHRLDLAFATVEGERRTVAADVVVRATAPVAATPQVVRRRRRVGCASAVVAGFPDATVHTALLAGRRTVARGRAQVLVPVGTVRGRTLRCRTTARNSAGVDVRTGPPFRVPR